MSPWNSIGALTSSAMTGSYTLAPASPMAFSRRTTPPRETPDPKNRRRAPRHLVTPPSNPRRKPYEVTLRDGISTPFLDRRYELGRHIRPHTFIDELERRLPQVGSI